MSDKHVFGLDEIAEENNKVPTWLFFTWIILLSWGFYYLVTYWTMPSDSLRKEVLSSPITYKNKREEGFVSSSKTTEVKEEKKADDGKAKLVADGKVVYEANCAGCHGTAGDGAGPAAAALNPKPRNFVKADYKYGGDDAGLTKTIQNGVQGTAMPAWKDSLNPDQIASVIAYVRTFKK
ncbi:MAG: c-type cytochrome [Candidatus Sericytochromatia bacterium]